MQIYVLSLKNSKYYVGKSEDVQKRINEHWDGYGSSWTKYYKPLDVINVYDMISETQEDSVTIDLMKKHGIDNVRGGSFVKFELPDYQVKTLEDIINSSNDSCFKCGNKGHFAKNCIFDLTQISEEVNKIHSKVSSNKKKVHHIFCVRCKRNSHTLEYCYASYDAYGNLISDSEDDDYSDDDSDDDYY